MLPPHPPMAEGPGGPMYNGLHAGDPAWSPVIKVVPNNADNSDPQQQVMSSVMLSSHKPGAQLLQPCLLFDLSHSNIRFSLSFQVWPGTWAPHVGNVHLNHVN